MRPTRNGFRNRLLGKCLATLLFSVTAAMPQAISDYFVGRPAPDFKLKDLDGNEVQLSALKGHIVLVDFWASWCGPCRMEIPMLEHISKEYEKKNVVVIGVNSDEPEDVVRRFADKNKVRYPIVLTEDNPGVIRAYAARSLPTVAVIDPNGIIVAYRVGVNPGTEGVLTDDIHHVLSAKYVPPQPKAMQLAQTPPQAPSGTAAVQNGPDQNWQPKNAEEFVARGYARLRTRKYPQARADAEDALKLRPGWPSAEMLRGLAAYEDRDYAASIKDFDEVIRQQPGSPDPYRYRGLAYSYSGQHERALPDYKKAIELEPYRAQAYNALGWAYSALGQLDLARTNLDKAIEIEPDFMMARENRAKLFGKLHDVDAELNELAVILDLRPTNQWAKDTQEALSQMQRGPMASTNPNH